MLLIDMRGPFVGLRGHFVDLKGSCAGLRGRSYHLRKSLSRGQSVGVRGPALVCEGTVTVHNLGGPSFGPREQFVGVGGLVLRGPLWVFAGLELA